MVLALVSLLQIGWFSYKSRQISNCQTAYNFNVAQVVDLRSQFADRDRNSLTSFIRTVAQAKTREESKAALDKYLATQDELEKQRDEHPIPKLPPGRCR